MNGDSKREQQAEAYARATNGFPNPNYAAIFQGFMAKGLHAQEIEPRVNVLTYQAWRHLGRHVRKGEHGVPITTWIDATKQRNGREPEPYRFARGVTVFHISQTEPDEQPAGEFWATIDRQAKP